MGQLTYEILLCIGHLLSASATISFYGIQNQPLGKNFNFNAEIWTYLNTCSVKFMTPILITAHISEI